MLELSTEPPFTRVMRIGWEKSIVATGACIASGPWRSTFSQGSLMRRGCSMCMCLARIVPSRG